MERKNLLLKAILWSHMYHAYVLESNHTCGNINNIIKCCVSFCFERGFHYVAQAVLEHRGPYLPLLECWDWKHPPLSCFHYFKSTGKESGITAHSGSGVNGCLGVGSAFSLTFPTSGLWRKEWKGQKWGWESCFIQATLNPCLSDKVLSEPGYQEHSRHWGVFNNPLGQDRANNFKELEVSRVKTEKVGDWQGSEEMGLWHCSCKEVPAGFWAEVC